MFSVALCTCNSERFIEAQLASILAQTMAVHEIVVCDDASIDNTLVIVRQVAATTDIPVRIHQNSERLGVTRNFEKAIGLTQGDIVFLCDHDDVWDSNKVAAMVAEFNRQPELLLLFADAELVDESGASLKRSLFEELRFSARERDWIRSGDPFLAFARRNLACGATTAFRRSLLESGMPFPSAWIHDEWLATIAAALGSIDFLDQALTAYRQHQNNQIGMYPLSWRGKFNKVLHTSDGFHDKLVERATHLDAHLKRLGPMVSNATCALAEEKLQHAVVRGALPSARLARVPSVLAELLRGRYFRCATGWLSVARDLLAPIRVRR
jgi:glycosyltransferase involved in cell wall biosynthesis